MEGQGASSVAVRIAPQPKASPTPPVKLSTHCETELMRMKELLATHGKRLSRRGVVNELGLDERREVLEWLGLVVSICRRKNAHVLKHGLHETNGCLGRLD